MSDLKTTITNAASEPIEVTQDGTTVKRQSLKDQIAADKYLGEKDRLGLGIVFRRISPPGAQG